MGRFRSTRSLRNWSFTVSIGNRYPGIVDLASLYHPSAKAARDSCRTRWKFSDAQRHADGTKRHLAYRGCTRTFDVWSQTGTGDNVLDIGRCGAIRVIEGIRPPVCLRATSCDASAVAGCCSGGDADFLAELVGMDGANVGIHGLRRPRCRLRNSSYCLADISTPAIYNFKRPSVGGSVEELESRQVAVCRSICNTNPIIHYILAVNRHCRSGCHRCLCRVHEHRIVCKSIYLGTPQYFDASCRHDVERQRWRRAKAAIHSRRTLNIRGDERILFTRCVCRRKSDASALPQQRI